MDGFWLKFKRLRPEAKLPTRAYNSAGYDLFTCASGVIYPGETVHLPCGFAMAFPFGWVAVIDDRSSTGSKNLLHLAGVIDSVWRGEVTLLLHNLVGDQSCPYNYSPDKAVAQILFTRIGIDEPVILGDDEDLDATERGAKWLGSSDK